MKTAMGVLGRPCHGACDVPTRGDLGALLFPLAGHHMQFVAKLSCDEPRPIFVLHCILANILSYVKAELNGFRLSVESNSFAANAANQAAYKGRDMFGSEPQASASVQERSTTRRPVKKRRKGTSRQQHGTSEGGKDALSFTPDDVPLSVRSAVYTSDERALGQVDGLSCVRRLPEGRVMMHVDSSGGVIGYEKVCWRSVAGVACSWQPCVADVPVCTVSTPLSDASGGSSALVHRHVQRRQGVRERQASRGSGGA